MGKKETSKIKTREISIGRGRSLVYYVDGIVVGGISWSYIPGNQNLGAFERNNRATHPQILVTYGSGVNQEVLHDGSAYRAWTRNEADKHAREYIRDNNLRQLMTARINGDTETVDRIKAALVKLYR